MNIINKQFGLFSIFLNHSINGEEFSHWWIYIYDVIFLLIRSRIFLLTLPISDLDGLISLNEALCGKLSLWSVTAICASWFCHWSTLSLINSLSAILFASSSTLLTFELVYLFYVLVILSILCWNNDFVRIHLFDVVSQLFSCITKFNGFNQWLLIHQLFAGNFVICFFVSDFRFSEKLRWF